MQYFFKEFEVFLRTGGTFLLYFIIFRVTQLYIKLIRVFSIQLEMGYEQI